MRSWSQAELCGHILKALGRLGETGVSARQLNAVVDAADLIVTAFDHVHVPATPGMGLPAWLLR